VTVEVLAERPPARPLPAPITDELAPPSRWLRAALWVASRTLRLMGRRRYVLADGLGLAIYASSLERARRTAANHRRLEPGISGAEARRRARGSYREFMRTSFDFVWEYAVPPEKMDPHFRSVGVDHVYQALHRYGGGVIALAHYGSWDVAAACALRLRIPVTTVMTTVGSSDLATRIAAWARRHQDLEVLMTRGAGAGLLHAVRSGRCAAILSDIPDRGQREIVDFCGGRVAFSTAPAWIARTTGVPVMAAHCWREDGRYVLRLYPPFEVTPDLSDVAVMQRLATTLEEQIRRDPTQWYPFGNLYKD
jgi:lauroyl/myristoyl acyltransferase